MEKTLSLYTYIDGINDMPFPNADEHIIVSTFTYDAKRMGDAPSINFTIKHTTCLDSVWTDNVYASFKGEKYFLKQTPTSAYDNSDSRYKHDVVMVSERIALNEAYFFDVVSSNSSDDRPVSNSSEVVFFGDVHEFALRLNASLLHSRLDYKVIVDDGVTSEAKLMSFKNQFFSNVLQEFYNTYNMPYYFVGKEIHVGQEATIIDEVFEYGVDNSLLSIEKSNANYKVVTRCTGTGGNDNIPYYYPNPTPYGDMVCLLNGKESSNVRVIDWARFARCGVDGVLSYNEKTAASGDAETPQKVYVGSSIYFNTVATAYGSEWEAQSEPFELEYAHNYLFINGSPNSQVIASWEWFVIDENDVVRENGSWSTGDTGVYLDNGVYTVKIRVRLNNTYGSNDEAQEIARINSYIDIYKQKQQEQYTEATYTWQLNDGSYVTLNSVGVNYDGTPQVGYTISFKTKTARIPVSTSLMPPIYRESLGKDRFYVAKNNTYKKANSDEYYSFNNIFVDGRPKDHIIEVDDIKPTIANVVNANNERIDSFIEFAYDLNDNDELDAENRYEHSFFYAKLRKMDGDFGFNLFDHASESGNMTVSMTSGVCGACNWEICVDENTGQNAVRVDENGNLLRDADGNVLYKGSAGRTQNDTTTEEVWVQLRKEDNTYGILMPNKAANHRPSVGDTFVLTNISLPQAYILAAEERLKHAIIEYMAQNNDEKFNFSIKFSRIYLAQHEAIMAQLSENATLKIKYNGVIYTLHVSSYSYKMSDNAALPEIVVQLSDTLTVQKNALQNAVSEIRYEVDTVVKSIDVGAMAAGQFVSKVNEDVISGTKTFLARSVFGDTVASKDFTRGSVTGVGWALYTEDVFNKVQDIVAQTTRATTSPQTVAKKQSVLELDKLIVRGKLEVNELTVNQAQFQKGTTILSGGACEIESIEVLTDSKGNSFYRCYYNNEQGTKNSGFFTGDFAKCLRFDMSSTNVVKEYWREVVGVGTAYVDLAFNGSSDDDGIPAIGDNIIQMGNKDNLDRQSFIVIDPLHKGSIQIYSGVNSCSLEDRNYVGMGVNPTTNEAYLYGYGDIYIGDRDIDAEGANFITYQKRAGDNKRKLFIAADIMLGAESTGLSNMSEFLDLKETVSEAINTTQDIEYLKNIFESGNILDVNGATLSSLIGVTNNEGILKAGLYGGGSDALNDKGYFDEEHGAMWLFGGIDGADKPTTYKTAIFEDGYIESEYFATAREGARVEMFDNQVKIFGSDGSTHILMGWSAETGTPELQYVDANGARPWLITSEGISNAVTIDTEQRILKVKDFDKGLKIGGLSVYKSQDDTIYLDCNLVVRGGITAFGTNETITASIFEALPIDGATLKRTENGVLYVDTTVVGGGGGTDGGISIADVENYLTTNGYATQSWVTGRGYFLASNFTKANIKSALGISDWALASAKPTYTASEVGALAQDSSSTNADLDTILENKTAILKPFFQSFTSNNIGSARKGVLRMTYNGSESQLLFDHYNRLLRYRTIGSNPKDWATLAFTSDIPTKLSQLTDDVVAGNYLSTLGGTVNGDITATKFIGALQGSADSAEILNAERLDDLNNGTRGRLFYSAFQSANTPNGVANYFAGLTFGYDSIKQLAMSYNGRLFTRYSNKTTWSNWREVAFVDNDNLSPASGTLTVNGNILSAGSITATSFIGNLTGVASNATYWNASATRPASANIAVTGKTTLSHFLATGSMTTGKPAADGTILHSEWDNNGGFSHQVFFANYSKADANNRMQWRAMDSGTWGEWKSVAFTDCTSMTPSSGTLTINGNILATGGVTAQNSSDRRLKKNIRKFNASKVLMSLGGVYEYEYIDSEVQKNHIYKGAHYGLIYQHVKGTKLDVMCHEREDGFGALNYISTDFISIIAGATMENISEVEKLKRKIRHLENKVKQLESRA